MATFLVLLVSIVVVGVVNPFNRFSSDTLEAIRNDPHLILYSLDPAASQPPTAETPLFRDYPVLEQTTLSNPQDRAAIAETLRQATRGVWDPAACFNPRHGLRATGPTGTYDLVICFECLQAVVQFPDGHSSTVLIATKPGPFDELVSAARNSLPKR